MSSILHRIINRSCSRRGLVLIELLTVIGIVGILALLIVTAVQQSRESARKLACASNLRQIGLSLNQYSSRNACVPAGMPSVGYSWLVALLPELEQAALYNQVNFSQRNLSFLNTLQRVQINTFLCPSDTISDNELKQTNYAGNFGRGVKKYGLDGLFHYEVPVYLSSITDGLSNTAAVSEWLVTKGIAPFEEPASRVIFDTAVRFNQPEEFEQFNMSCVGLNINDSRRNNLAVGVPWTHGHLAHALYNLTGRPFDNKCTNANMVQEGAYNANSLHSNGVNVLFADGHLQFVKKTVALETWRAIGSKAGGDSLQSSY